MIEASSIEDVMLLTMLFQLTPQPSRRDAGNRMRVAGQHSPDDASSMPAITSSSLWQLTRTVGWIQKNKAAAHKRHVPDPAAKQRANIRPLYSTMVDQVLRRFPRSFLHASNAGLPVYRRSSCPYLHCDAYNLIQRQAGQNPILCAKAKYRVKEL